MNAYSIDTVEHSDFFWVFVTRTFYYMCISLQAFGLFMLRDVQQVDDPTFFTSILAMTGQLCAAVVAVPSGRLSDRLGRKPLVFASCAMMAVRRRAPSNQLSRAHASCVAPTACPTPLTPPAAACLLLGSWSTSVSRSRHLSTSCSSSALASASAMVRVALSITARPRRLHRVWADGLLRTGMFLSVDYALACDVLPSFQTAAQGLGLWGVSAFLGSTIGPLIAGPLLAYFGATDSAERYGSDGYVALNATGAVYVALAAFFLRYVSAR